MTGRIPIRAIIEAVAHEAGFTPEQLTGPDRSADIALARHAAMYLARSLTSCSLAVIGRAFGGRDHTTVSSAVRRVEVLIADDADLHALIALVGNALSGVSAFDLATREDPARARMRRIHTLLVGLAREFREFANELEAIDG